MTNAPLFVTMAGHNYLEMTMDVLICLWVAFCVVAALCAMTKGRSGVAWFAIAMIITPLLAWPLAACLPRVNKAPSA